MSEDTRNSINLWVGGLAFFGLIWAALHFGILRGLSEKWLWPALGIVVLFQFGRGLWQRRANAMEHKPVEKNDA